MLAVDRGQKIFIGALESSVRKTLAASFNHPEYILDEQSAVFTECTLCDTPTEVCMRHPGRLCRRARKAGTILDEYESAIRRIRERTFGTCLACGVRIETARLLQFPETSVCRACSEQTLKRISSITKKGSP